MTDKLPPDALCERCWAPVIMGERAVRLGHVVGSTLTGDIQWAYTYLHYYDRETGCVRREAGVGE